MSASRKFSPFGVLGPGLIVAAAGIGAGDVITATVTGAKFASSTRNRIGTFCPTAMLLTVGYGANVASRNPPNRYHTL